ncbi:NAD(P)/FAD-dependent oxidoreductase [soil metagenome]
MPDYDVIVVGARCAGASLAMLLARAGRRVLAIDRARFPSDTLSTHFLWPRTTAFLASWGLLEALAATGCPPIETVRIHFGSATVAGRPEPVDGTDVMYCPRRTVLDALLVEAARRAGAEVREGTTMRAVLRDGDRVVGVRAVGPDGEAYEARATMVVGADGMMSGVADAVQAPLERSHPSLTCGFYAYWRDLPTDGVEFYLRDGRDVLVFPTHDDLTCLWVGKSSSDWPAYKKAVEASYLGALDASLLVRVRAAERATRFKGTHRLPNHYRTCWGDGWALVGDAAYHRDPLTGMGIGDAFLGAQLLADALDAGLSGNRTGDLAAALAGYQQALWDRTASVFDYTLQSAALKDPAPLAPLYAEIARRPEMTQRLMNVLGGTAPARSLFNVRTMMQLAGARPRGRKPPPAPAPGDGGPPGHTT